MEAGKEDEDVVARNLLGSPQASSKVAVGVNLTTGELMPFAVGPQAILEAVKKVARNGEGNRCPLSRAREVGGNWRSEDVYPAGFAGDRGQV